MVVARKEHNDNDDNNNDEAILRSLVQYEAPKEGTNVARELMAALRRHQGRKLVLEAESGREWTGSELLDSSLRVASGLISGCQTRPGQVVMLLCQHSIRELQLALGLTLAGVCFFGASPSDGLDEIRTLCHLVKPNFIATDNSGQHLAVKLKSELGNQIERIIWMDKAVARDENNNIIVAEDCGPQSSNLDDLLSHSAHLELVEAVASHQIEPDKHMFSCLLTSGSTGRPKVVPMTHRMATWGVFSMLSACRNSLPQEGGHILALDESSVVAGDLPLDHGAGLYTLVTSLLLGSKLVVMASYQEDTFWEAVSRHRITASISSTTFAYQLLVRLKQLIDSNELERRRWDLSSFRWLTCCGSKLAFHKLVHQIQLHLPQLRVGQSYGCTEIGFISGMSPAHCTKPGSLDSVGHLYPGLEAKIVDRRTGKPVKSPNERGELVLRSPAQFSQYLCHHEDDPVQLMLDCHAEGGFYKTGDQVHCDLEGRLFVHGRYKETLCLAADWQILPVELETLIDQHPLVAQSVVVGLPDPDLPGCHAPRAFVKLVEEVGVESGADEAKAMLAKKLEQQDKEFIKQHICQFVQSRVAPAKRLKGGVIILDEFPRVGLLNKVDRKALKAFA